MGLELTDEMDDRVDDVHQAAYEFILTLLEKEEDEFEWDFAIIGDVADAAISTLTENHNLKVRYPAVVTNVNGTQHYCEWQPCCCGGEK